MRFYHQSVVYCGRSLDMMFSEVYGSIVTTFSLTLESDSVKIVWALT
jgi:hypothetical protein